MADRAVWQRTIVDERGNIIPGAEVTVRSYPGGSLVMLYENPEGTPKSNPFVTGNDGFARFWANSQRVEIVAVGAGSSIRWIVDLLNADEVIGDAVTEATAAAAVAVSEAEAAADRAEAARDAAQLSAGIYEDIAAGLAATTDGDYFSVPAGDYLILYRNNGGAAEEISRTPSTTEVKNAVQRVDDLAGSEELQSLRATIESADYSVAFTDKVGNVAGGFDKQGRFVARIGQQVEQFEVKTGEQYVWGVTDEVGALALGVDKEGNAAASGLNLPGYDVRSVSSPDVSFAVADEEGRVALGVDKEGNAAASGLTLPGYDIRSLDSPDIAFAITDELGRVALGVDRAGNAAASGLTLPGYDIRSLDSPDIAFAITDEQGRAAFIVYEDGTTSAGGGGDPGPGPITHTVEWSFAETIDDPSKELFVTWLTDSPDAKVLEYRPKGGQVWMAASSFRTRPFPVLSDLWLHTVELRNLTPDTVYEYRIPGSQYADAVKTCPNLDKIRMIMASDWQNTNYSPSSPLRNFGNIATSKEPDLYIFNGDFSNSDGRFTEFWANDYRTMFGVFHDHWRSAGGVQVPWIMVYGNHEARNAAGTSNAYSGGDGTPGMLGHICSWTYAELHDTKFARSVSTVRIRNLVAFICLETDHTVPISSQMDWMEGQLQKHSPEVAHTFLVGHNPPFHHRTIDRANNAANRYMRNVMWPIAQQYSDGGTLRAFLAAHSHALAVTNKLKMAYDPMASDAVNDRNFFQDDGGFYCIGNGAVGAPNIGILDPPDQSFVSNIDGKFPWLAFAGRDMEDNPLTVGPVQNMIWPPHNIWVFDISETGGWKAESLNANGDLFYEVDETE